MILNWLNKLAEKKSPLRPPGAVPEEEFADRCIRCRKCEQVCRYKSIKSADSSWGLQMGTPMIFARDVPCYLCMECPPVCPSGALEPIKEKEKVKMGIAEINEETCLPFMGIICRACYERCPIYREAIILRDELYPQVVEEKCTGCGICENVCPADSAAITIVSSHFSSKKSQKKNESI